MVLKLSILVVIFAIVKFIDAIPASRPTFMMETIYMEEDCSIPDRIFGYRAIKTDCSDPRWTQVGCNNGSIWSFCTYNPDEFIRSVSEETPYIGYYETPLIGSTSNPQAPPNFQIPGKMEDFEEIKYHPLDSSCLTKEQLSLSLSYNPAVKGIQALVFGNVNCSGEPIFGKDPNQVTFTDDQIFKDDNIYKIVSFGNFEIVNFTSYQQG